MNLSRFGKAGSDLIALDDSRAPVYNEYNYWNTGCATGVTWRTTRERIFHNAVRLGKAFDLRIVCFFIFRREDGWGGMKMAFVLFDGMTTMDFVGFYEAITWLGILKAKEDVSWAFCANQADVVDDRGLRMRADRVLPDLSDYDLVFVPGGYATRRLRFDPAFVSWIRTARGATYHVSVCTGALLLGAAGLLEGKRATTNPSAYELLSPYCAEVVRERYVRDGDVYTGGGVSASIDLGLYVVESLAGREVARQVQEKMDYPYYAGME